VTQIQPQPCEIRETLERILASETFARSERARKLLRYLIEEEQAGNADRLKGVTIAMDVFGKDAAHDPATDAQVRVQAGRLRDLLDQYFNTEGHDEPVRITIPRGGYVPSYEGLSPGVPATAGTAAGPALQPPSPRRGRRAGAGYLARQLRMFWAAITVVIGLLGFVAYNSWRDSNVQMSIAANAAPANRIAEAAISLPHVFLTFTGDAASKKAAGVFRTALTGFDTVVYIARNPPNPGDAAPLDFEFNIDPGPNDGSVTVELQNVRSGEVILSRLIDAEQLAPDQIDAAVADVITATLPVSGAVYAYLESNNLQRGLTRCLLLNDDYYLAQSAQKHMAAYQCFEGLLASGAHSPLIFSELASLQLEAVSDRYPYPPDPSMEKALASARQAIQMAPNSPYAHRAYGFVYTRMGVEAESLKWMKRAYELGRFDMNMAAAYGYAMIMAGQYAEGTPVMERAVTISSAKPSWWDYTLFLGEFMLDNKQLAARATDALTANNRPHYLGARMIAAYLRGDARQASLIKAELNQKQAKFVKDPRAFYERADYPAAMIDKLVDGLRQASQFGET